MWSWMPPCAMCMSVVFTIAAAQLPSPSSFMVGRSRHNQSYKPVLEQSEAVGHAVNCVTLMVSLTDVGTLESGKWADFVVLDADPLTDISLLAADGKNRRTIVKGGEVVKDELR